VNDVLRKKTVMASLWYYLCLTGRTEEVKTMRRNWTRRSKEREISNANPNTT